ncbi:hypothetical protein C0580_01760 [Candidatus Parcubacteria bacterium]|nr:MAG: hypothetical protein C0580_01760 [Candidatus Parcubacteria bacterium]
MRINKKITVLFIVFLAVIFLLPQVGLAQGDIFGANQLQNTNLGTRTLYDTIVGVVNVLLGLLGIIAVGIMIYGGYTWMTSQGNPDKIDRAKKILVNGVIGLMIIVSSYAIANFVLNKAFEATVSGGGGPGPGGYSSGSGLGATVLDSHFPPNCAVNVARNTNIFVSFREDIDTSLFIVTSGCNNGAAACLSNNVTQAHIRVIDTDAGTPISGSDIAVTVNDPAHPTHFELNPYNNLTGEAGLLGSPSEDTNYRVELNGLSTALAEPVFPLGSYTWEFRVGTFVDNTPPEVTFVMPDGLANPYVRNSVVQINFSEAVNPMHVTGIVDVSGGPPDLNLSISEAGGDVYGRYEIANQYRTVEFISSEPCGVNSCGFDIYCLPPSATIDGLVMAGVRDMAGNLLESGGDPDVHGEVPADEYPWSFDTNNDIDLTPPYITYMDSGVDINLTDPIYIVFSKSMSVTSINGSNMALYRNNIGDTNFSFAFDTTVLPNDTVQILHDEFLPLTDYTATSTSNIQDSAQNCWYPCNCVGPSCDCNPSIYCGPGGCTTY